jgi:hypothetical protein
VTPGAFLKDSVTDEILEKNPEWLAGLKARGIHPDSVNVSNVFAGDLGIAPPDHRELIDQRHRVNAWVLAILPGEIYLNNRLSAYSAQPASESCGADNQGTGQRAATPGERICPNGSVLQRNTIRRDNRYFSWDIRASKPFELGAGTLEVIFEAFNVTNSDNFKDPASGGTFLNFDGTIRSGLGEPRQFQAGVRYLF